MTYCIGIKTKEGLVFASDSRTNAGMDNVNIYSKMFTHKINVQKYSKHLIYIDLQFAKYEIYELADVDCLFT